MRQYVRTCPACQRTKTFPARPIGLLVPNPIPQQPWEEISVDLITGLPDSQGYDAIMVVVDCFTKMIHALPTNGTVSSEGVARLFRDNVWKLHGLPKRVISDRGPQFASRFMRALNQALGITTALSTAYHPQTDGQTERVNQEIEQYLRLFVNYRQDDWTDWLSIAEFSHNNRLHTSTDHSPFYLNYGRQPRSSFTIPTNLTVESAEDFAQRMKTLHKQTTSALEQTAARMKKYYDRRHTVEHSFKIGDRVYLDAADLRTLRPSRKLSDKRLGPFKITKVISPVNYQLQLPRTWKLSTNTFHVSKLRESLEDESLHGPVQDPPPPELIDDHEEYEVEGVLDSRVSGRQGLQYLVRWKGYGNEENSWEPARNLSNAPDLVQKYHREHPLAPQHMATLTTDSIQF